MTKEQAINYLIALAYCSIPALTCDECPLFDTECKWNDAAIVEAVRVLKGEGNELIHNKN